MICCFWLSSTFVYSRSTGKLLVPSSLPRVVHIVTVISPLLSINWLPYQQDVKLHSRNFPILTGKGNRSDLRRFSIGVRTSQDKPWGTWSMKSTHFVSERRVLPLQFQHFPFHMILLCPLWAHNSQLPVPLQLPFLMRRGVALRNQPANTRLIRIISYSLWHRGQPFYLLGLLLHPHYHWLLPQGQ